ncbi:MAG: class I SAM-dependent methyltransferase [Simkaniaceae bacterium]
MTAGKVFLKRGREKPLQRRHPWIFSGAVDKIPDFENGAVLPVYSHQGEFLAKAYFNKHSQLFGRVLSFEDIPTEKILEKKISSALAQRQNLRPRTNAFRLINGEGDGLPGLIVDHYAKVLVLQVHTLGIEKLKPLILPLLKKAIAPLGIYEQSDLAVRKLEGLDPMRHWIEEGPAFVEIEENGIKFHVSIEKGQKTGFFLDQREMRKLIADLSKNKRVLNCFSYTGGFSLYALRGGASKVTSVDISKEAVSMMQKNTRMNNFSLEKHEMRSENVFHFIRNNQEAYDMVILDPPAFIKKREDKRSGLEAYKKLNFQVMSQLPENSLLLTCSCSHFMDRELFQKIIFESALQAKKEVKILSRHRQALDHPTSLFHLEGEYLKSFLLSLC